ncbi:MAG: AAA family ATPase [Myxococcota bacterium]|nr:AAA family ATPase [Myxococcota bacterium]
MSEAVQALRLSGFSIENLGGIEHLEVEGLPEAKGGQWIVVLGDNGSGKSSLLRGLALSALSWNGGTPVGLLETTPLALRREGSLARLSFGIRWDVSSLKAQRDGVWSTGPNASRSGSTHFLAAYGVARGGALAGPDRAVDLENPYGAVATLFALPSQLVHAETWLVQVRFEALESGDPQFFDAVSSTLLSLLPGASKLEVKREGVWIEGEFGRVPLSGLSDGYITTLGWTLDLLARWEKWARSNGVPLGQNFAKEMTGLVLVDELDLHLHPRWQRNVIGSLRRAFPNLSFVCTTHNPLTLLGAKPGEVFTLEQEEGGHVLIQRDLPKGIRADQVLTGPWFGLSSTLDRGTLQMLGRHRNLLADGVARDDPDRVALEGRIRSRLGSYAELSEERLALSAVQQLFEDEPELSAADRMRALDLLNERVGEG